MTVTQETHRYPVDNLTYDLLTVIAEKSKALEAYDRYLQDAAGQESVRSLLEEARRADIQAVEQVLGCLTERLRDSQATRNEREAAAKAAPL